MRDDDRVFLNMGIASVQPYITDHSIDMLPLMKLILGGPGGWVSQGKEPYKSMRKRLEPFTGAGFLTGCNKQQIDLATVRS